MTRSGCVRLAQASVRYPLMYVCSTKYFFVIPRTMEEEFGGTKQEVGDTKSSKAFKDYSAEQGSKPILRPLSRLSDGKSRINSKSKR